METATKEEQPGDPTDECVTDGNLYYDRRWPLLTKGKRV